MSERVVAIFDDYYRTLFVVTCIYLLRLAVRSYYIPHSSSLSCWCLWNRLTDLRPRKLSTKTLSENPRAELCLNYPSKEVHDSVLDGMGASSKGIGSFGMKLPLLRSCVEMREPIALSFGMVSGVGPGIDVRNGGRSVSRGRGCFWDFLAYTPCSFEWAE